MWFTDTFDLPDVVVQARLADQLVVFVGAGVSMGPPSNLPSFGDLAQAVANDLSVPCDGAKGPDVFLDRLVREDRPVRRSVVNQLSDPASQPNALHTAIVRLFDDIETIRIVTTNYDQHLSTVTQQTFGALPPIYAGPALSLGHKFHGLVHLHETLSGPEDELVITTSDFGRAYLTDAWAARFLNDLFHQYVTLFVGYSHSDVVMRYLAQGLRPGSRRFGFIADTVDPEEWRPLEVHPIVYPAASNHQALTEAIATWGDRLRMGQLDHQQRVQEAVALDPPQGQAATAYLESVIADDRTARLFAEHASGTKWLAWITDRAPFPSLFAPGEILSEAGATLAFWFATIAGSDPKAALDVAQRHGGRLHRITAQSLLWQFRQHRPDAKDLGRWVSLLIENTTPSLDHELSTLLAQSRWPEDADAALMLFSHLVTHRGELQPAFPNLMAASLATDDVASSGAPRLSVDSLNGDDYWLRQAWTSFFTPHLDKLVTPLTEILTARLADAHRALRGVGQASEGWDEQSFHRSAIAPDDQDSIPWPSYLLVDALRDCVELLVSTRPEEAASLIDRLQRSAVPLLRRIALHGWTVRTDVSADEKLAHLVVSGDLYAFATKRETYRVIEIAGPTASDARDDLLRAALQGPPDRHSSSDDRIDTGQTLNLVSWIAQCLPDFPAAKSAFEQFQKAHSDLHPFEHPGYDSWMGPSGVVTSHPFPVEEVLKRQSAADLDLLIDKAATADPDAVTLWAFRIPDVLADSASKSIPWAQGVLTGLSQANDWMSRFWTAILPGVSRAVEQAEDAQLISFSQLLGNAVHHVSSAEGGQLLPRIAELLMAVVRPPHLRTEVLDAAEAVGARVVDKMHLGAGAFIKGDPREVLERALNDWTGWITRFWVDAISHRRTLAGDSWTGFSDDAKRTLEGLLGAPAPYSTYPQVMLAANFTFLNEADEAWATEQVRPLFAWADDHARAARAWSSFLAGAPWNERISTALNSDLRVGFKELRGDLGKALASRFGELIVQTYSNGHIDGTLSTFIAAADDEMRIAFAARTSWLLLHLFSPEYAESQWPRWIEHYLAERLAERPRPFIPLEAGQMLGWVVAAGSHFPDAVASYTSTNARFAEFYGLFNEIKKRQLSQQYPDPLAQLLRHVVERSDPAQSFVCPDVGALLSEVIPAVDPAQRSTLLAICEAAAKLHCPEAASWKAEVEKQWPEDR